MISFAKGNEMSRAAAWIVLLLTRTASSSFIPGSNRRSVSIVYATTSSTSTHQQHGGIPIGAVQLSGAHVESFKDLVADTLYTSSIFRGVEPFIGPRSRTQQSRQMLIHVSPVVATALDDNHPTLVKFVEENNGVYIPGLRRSRMHKMATRKKKNAMKELSSSSYCNLDRDSRSDNNIAPSSSSKDDPTTAFTFGELFAGIGGFRLGLEAIGGRCVFANEMNPYAASIYRKHFGASDKKASGSSLIEADILDLNESRDIPNDMDILSGGFPCQPFSSRGKQEGFNDERGQLYREIVRVLRACHPKSFLLENVAGLVRMESSFSTILRAFEECGYTVSWRICNSMHYVAQQRERVFIVGIRNDLVDNSGYSWEWFDKMLQSSSEGYDANPIVVRDIMEHPDSSAVSESDISAHQWLKLKDIHSKRNGIESAYINIDTKAPTLISSYRRTGNHTSKFILTERDGTKRSIPRFLTPRECCRIQGFPEEYYAPSIRKDGSDATAHFYVGIGNAVVPQIVSSIGKELVRCLYP